MRAVQINKYGGAETLKLQQIDIPKINRDDILIEVHSAAVNPIDWKIREGYLQDLIPYNFPMTLGWDVSGTICELGKDVTGFDVGDEVFSRPNISRNGSYADYIAVKADEAIVKSATLDFTQAAALPLAGITAWQCLIDAGKLIPDQRVLIHAGAGGVDHLAIQIAKAKGAMVIATASTANQSLLKDLGADQAVDYTKAPLREQIEPVDLVIDTIGGDVQTNSWPIIKKGGLLIAVTEQPNRDKAQEYEVKREFVFIEPSSRILRELNTLVEAKQLMPIIELHFPLEQIAKAHFQSQSGRTRGKIVIDVA